MTGRSSLEVEGTQDDGGRPVVTPPVRSRTQIARVTTPEAWEVRRAELMPLFLEHRTLDEIATHFGVSQRTAHEWRTRLLQDIRDEVPTPRDFIMDRKASLDAMRAEAWRVLYDSIELKDRRGALNELAKIETLQLKLGELVGFYGLPGDRPLETGTESIGGHERMKDALTNFLSTRDQIIDVTPQKAGHGAAEPSEGP